MNLVDIKRAVIKTESLLHALASLVEAQGKQIDELKAQLNEKRPYRRRNPGEDRGSGTE